MSWLKPIGIFATTLLIAGLGAACENKAEPDPEGPTPALPPTWLNHTFTPHAIDVSGTINTGETLRGSFDACVSDTCTAADTISVAYANPSDVITEASEFISVPCTFKSAKLPPIKTNLLFMNDPLWLSLTLQKSETCEWTWQQDRDNSSQPLTYLNIKGDLLFDARFEQITDTGEIKSTCSLREPISISMNSFVSMDGLSFYIDSNASAVTFSADNLNCPTLGWFPVTLNQLDLALRN